MMLSYRIARRVAFVALVSTIAFPVLASAQEATITGMVRSSRGDTLQGAQVRIPELNVAVGTDARGMYRISLAGERVRGQPITLAVRAIGYRPQGKTITLAPGVHRESFTLAADTGRRGEVVVMDSARNPSATGKQLAFTVNRSDSLRITPVNTSFSQHLFPPELIMQNQARLRITESQREAILREIVNVQATATQAQWRVAEESERLNALLERDNVAEPLVLEQARQLIDQETVVKQAQLSMLIRIRNVLTAEQRAMLRGLRRDE